MNMQKITAALKDAFKGSFHDCRVLFLHLIRWFIQATDSNPLICVLKQRGVSGESGYLEV